LYFVQFWVLFMVIAYRDKKSCQCLCAFSCTSQIVGKLGGRTVVLQDSAARHVGKRTW
jgi:hypothetical protein